MNQKALFLALILFFPAAAGADQPGRAQYLSSFNWVMDKPWFGGWSGLEISPDGSGLIAITDRGRLIKATLDRQKGRITTITPRKWWRLKSSSGRALTRKIADSEGLAVAADGTIFVSFEGVARIARYSRPAAPAQVLRHPRDFRGFSRNKSLEALAIDPQDRLFAIPERVERDQNIRVFVFENDQWSIAFTLPGSDGFLPVGADFGPDGRLYLLERAWSALGFRTRVRRWDVAGGTPQGEQLLVQTATGTHDNLEGLAVWRDDNGRIRLTMIADDNFLLLQQTELVEYVLNE